MHKQKCLVCYRKYDLLHPDLFDDRYSSQGKYDILVCINCGFGRTIPTLDKKKISKFYSKFYPLSNTFPEDVQKAANIKPFWHDWLMGNDYIAHRHIKKGSKVLDVGSGNGVSLLEIAKLEGKPYGVEPDPHAHVIAKKLYLNVQKGFITDNPFPQIKFDFITATQVLEHEPDPELFLQAAYKKLSPKGQVILSFPNINSLYRKIFGRYWLHWHVPYHINFFSKNSFSILAGRCNFKITVVKTVTNNLWTLLQLSMLVIKPIEGKTSPIWATQHLEKKEKQALNFKLRKYTFEGVKLLSFPFIALFNRIIDIFGQGDCIYVVLEKR